VSYENDFSEGANMNPSGALSLANLWFAKKRKENISYFFPNQFNFQLIGKGKEELGRQGTNPAGRTLG